MSWWFLHLLSREPRWHERNGKPQGYTANPALHRVRCNLRNGELLGNKLERLLVALDSAFQLRVLNRLKNLLEYRAGSVAPGNKVVSPQQGRGFDLFGRRLREHAARHLVVGEVAMTGQAIEAVQLQVLVKAFHAQESQLGRAPHVREVL